MPRSLDTQYPFRCDMAGGFDCPGPGLYCGVPCDGYPKTPAELAKDRELRPRALGPAPAETHVGWYCPACAAEVPVRAYWDLRAYRPCPTCGSALALTELDQCGSRAPRSPRALPG